MQALLHDLTTPPTLYFAGALLLAVAYWTLVLSGIFDLEFFEGLEGAAEVLEDGGGIDTGLLGPAGFGELPWSVTGTLIAGFSFVASLLGETGVRWVTGRAIEGTAEALMLAVGAVVVAFGATIAAIQPLRKAMKAGLGPKRSELVGAICVVQTQRVDAAFGQAELVQESQLVQVRNNEDEGLGRGDRAVIFAYDPDAEVFWITRAAERPIGTLPDPAALVEEVRG